MRLNRKKAVARWMRLRSIYLATERMESGWQAWVEEKGVWPADYDIRLRAIRVGYWNKSECYNIVWNKPSTWGGTRSLQHWDWWWQTHWKSPFLLRRIWFYNRTRHVSRREQRWPESWDIVKMLYQVEDVVDILRVVAPPLTSINTSRSMITVRFTTSAKTWPSAWGKHRPNWEGNSLDWGTAKLSRDA